MAVMGFVKFERFFRAAGGVGGDRDDNQRYLDFVNGAIYDLLITKGLQESIHSFERLEEDIEIQPILEQLAARPPLDKALADDTAARLSPIFGGISVALARTFKLIDADVKAVHSEEWERAFSFFRLLI